MNKKLNTVCNTEGCNNESELAIQKKGEDTYKFFCKDHRPDTKRIKQYKENWYNQLRSHGFTETQIEELKTGR